jgi:hypothetical protein
MHSAKNPLYKTQYSAFTPDSSTSGNKSTDFRRFQSDREDSNYNDKIPIFKKLITSNRGSEKKIPDFSQTAKSLIVSQKDYRYTSIDQQTPSPMSLSTKFPSNRY